MKIKISDIKINPGRRKAKLEPVAELAKSIAAVGLLNPITLTEDRTLVAGLHRLEAAKRLGWTEIECAFTDVSGPQLELAEIDENIVRKGLTRQELGEQLSRRKELYETLHPETKAGTAQAMGMNRAIGNNVGAKLASTPKSFIEDTAEKTGLSKRTISRMLQIANNLTPDAKRIVSAYNMTQDTALKLSRLPDSQQVEAASMLAAGVVQSVEQYQQERQEKIQEVNASLAGTLPEGERSLDGLKREFMRFIDQFLVRMIQYQGITDDFAKMSELQISQVWDSVAAMDMAIIEFCKEVKDLRAERQ